MEHQADESLQAQAIRLASLLAFLYHRSTPISHVHTIDISKALESKPLLVHGTNSIAELERIGVIRRLSDAELRRLAFGKKIAGSFVELSGWTDSTIILRILDASDARTVIKARIEQSNQAIQQATQSIERIREYPSIYGDSRLTLDEISDLANQTEEQLNTRMMLDLGHRPLSSRGKLSVMRSMKHVEVQRAQIALFEELFRAIEEGQQQTNSSMTRGLPTRLPIPESVRHEVWRRDGARCTSCGSQKELEFDHIIPVSKGGGSSARNIQLLCHACNARKSAQI